MVFVVSQIRSGAKILKKWFGCSISDTCKFLELYSSMVDGSLDGTNISISSDYATAVCHVRVGKSASGDFIDVQVDLEVTEVVKSLGIYVEYVVEKIDESEPVKAPSLQSDVFRKMMQNAKDQQNLPEIGEEKNKTRLQNDIIKYLNVNKVGWAKDSVGTLGLQFVDYLTDCLWYIDGSHATLESRSFGVPAELSHFQHYNKPESHRHKRKCEAMLTKEGTSKHNIALLGLTVKSYMKSNQWQAIRAVILKLAVNLGKYAAYLEKQVSTTQEKHKVTKTFPFSDTGSFDILHPKLIAKPTLKIRYGRLSEALLGSDMYQVLCINDYAPADPKQRYVFVKELALPCRTVMYSHTITKLNMHFLWKIPADALESDVLNKSTKIREKLLKELPIYHTRAMRTEFISSFGRVAGCKSAVLREAYRRLTGDCSAARTVDEEGVDKRVYEFLQMEDPDLIFDLRVDNKGQPEKYELFLEECKKYIESSVDTAPDERRFDTVDTTSNKTTVITHLATALSVRALHEQVQKRLPDGTPIPSIQWLRIQFWPQRSTAATSKYFTGKIKLKFMIQSRQFRCFHVDAHYASALFRYQKEFSIRFREFTSFFCMDDKHSCKVGEPSCPVAAVERGRRVIVRTDQSFQVSDHDFSKISVTPSVALDVNIPESIEGSFYDGQVSVGVKEHCFEPSSPIRHVTELYNIIKDSKNDKEIICMYTDGGPDHRVTYISVQISLIALFLKTNADMVMAVRTPPQHSWKDPAERIMSILNIGLQATGLMRDKVDDTYLEHKLKSASNMKEIRALAHEHAGLKEGVKKSVRPVKLLLKDIFSQLKLKEKPFIIFESASEEDIDAIWKEILKVDQSLTTSDTTKLKIRTKEQFKSFLLSHCCQRHYMFSVKKCEDLECLVCEFPRLPPNIFQTLHHLPDPVPVGEHYKSFDELYGTNTTEEHRPSLKESKVKSHGMPFSPTAQYAKNINLVVTCSDCDKPRVCYAQKKIDAKQKSKIERELEDVDYSCGSSFDSIDDLEKSPLRFIHVRKNLSCNSLIEVPYYGTKNVDVCIHCGGSESLLNESGYYPLCNNCSKSSKKKIQKCATNNSSVAKKKK